MRFATIYTRLFFIPALFLWCLSIQAQPSVPRDRYASLWQKVQDAENKGLTGTALDIVNRIYDEAKSANNAPQLVRAFICKLKYSQLKEEDSFVKNLDKLKKEATDAVFPASPLLHSMLAELYWRYYQQNRFRFRQRTETSGYTNDDISTWSLNQIVQEVVKNYQLSLTEEEKSKETRIDFYTEVLSEGNGKARALRPTLYDFLAHRAVDFYMSEEPAIVRPAFSFSLDSSGYLSDAGDFCTLRITSKDTLSFKFYAMKIFQDLIRFHLKDKDPDALVDVDLKRLQFVKQYLVSPGKQELYTTALEHLEQKTSIFPVSALVTCQLAKAWMESAALYRPLQSEDHKWDLKKAMELCRMAEKRFPASDGALMAADLENEIRVKSLAANIEKVNVPGLPFRALVSYRNFTALNWRIVPVTAAEVRAERVRWQRNYDVNQDRKFLEHFVSKTSVKSGNILLPSDSDFQEHAVEVKLDSMTAGDYMVIFSAGPGFETTGNGLAYALITVSNLSYIHRDLDDGSTEFYILNRTSGDPVAGASVQLFFSVYNSGTSAYENIKGETFITGADGRVLIPYQNGKKSTRSDSYRPFFAEITWQNDHLSTQDIDTYRQGYEGQFSQFVLHPSDVSSRTLFFLDRSIYRPGQTIYFKGLLFSDGGKNPEILPQHRQTVTFYDANSQVVGKKEVTTNDYGTFNGMFTAPANGLTGQMYLQMDDDTKSSAYFSVEEYKRPNFEVAMDTLHGTYLPNENVHVTGKAVAYSGAVVGDATVTYRVVRQARFPEWWWSRYGFYPASPEMEITEGTSVTDAEGKFSIDFKAIPDENVDKRSDPVFTYVISSDITDMNGETHSGQSSVNVGYKALVLGVKMNRIDKSNKESLNQRFVITTTNMAGQFEPASGTIQVWKLRSPEKTFRNRLWNRPDKFVMTKDEFYASFPHDLYYDELNFSAWPREKEVFRFNFDSSHDRDFSIPKLRSWDPGKYVLEITGKDTFGHEVKNISYFEVDDNHSKSLAYPVVHLFEPVSTTCEPGEKAVWLAGSSEKINVLCEVEHDGKIVDKHRFAFDNEKGLFDIPVKEEYRGNIAIHYVFVKDNRLYSETSEITVPYTNKQLDIRFETFRDKLQPGQQEQWKIRISGHHADKVMAEMVASMYDASLDAFLPHSWNADIYHPLEARLSWSSLNGFEQELFGTLQDNWNEHGPARYLAPTYDRLNWFGYRFGNVGLLKYKSMHTETVIRTESNDEEIVALPEVNMKKHTVAERYDLKKAVDAGVQSRDSVIFGKRDQRIPDLSGIQARKHFNETAFFFPDLRTDENGEIILSFTVPEALTRWKMMGFAHTKDLQTGSMVKELITQKSLMVVPNQPRFFREGDKMSFSVKITSLADSGLSGEAKLEFFDALTMKTVNASMQNTGNQKPFSLKPKQSTNVEWNIEIPEGIQAITYRVVAGAGPYTDGEEMTLPVVPNRTLVTETLPLPVRGNQTRDFRFQKLLNDTSATLKNYRFTLEFTSNPAWYAIQALPYLMEYPYECTEQTFSRFYANAIASFIANSDPKIKHVFDLWATIQPDALLSNLEKNQELKSALLEETPWVLNAKDESQRKRNVALLFDLNRMAAGQGSALQKIIQAQSANGGFSWFPGLPEDRYITQHLVAGLGHLDAMGVKSVREDGQTWQMVRKAIAYLDGKMQDHYAQLKAQAKKGLLKAGDVHPDYTEIHYLYARRYFKDIPVADEQKEGFDYFLTQAKKFWVGSPVYMQGMICLALNCFGMDTVSHDIVRSLAQRALHSDEMGMYWKSDRGYFWYQAPVETQALMIEVFDEVAKDPQAVDELKIWLLKQKQIQDWKTTKATADACYALLRRGTGVLANDRPAEITVGGKTVDPAVREDARVEAGTGYFKTAWTAPEITPDMGNIRVTNPNNHIAWGAAYWQYFEQMDKITSAETPLTLKKQLFLQKNTANGPVITPITKDTELHPGDLVKVRIELRADRTMEYLHLKDMRAAGLEPVETLSASKYQDGLWYYQSSRDLTTSFFIAYLPKGTYVFEYPLRVSQKGDFSNGIATIQCMYAPEFSSHSEGIRVKVR